MTHDRPTDDHTFEVASDGALALFAGVAALAGSYAAVGFTPEWVAAPVSAFVVATTPDAVVAWSIQTLGDLGHQLSLLLALALTVSLFAVAAGLGTLLANKFSLPSPPFAGLACVAVAVALTGAVTSALAAGVGAALVLTVGQLSAGSGDSSSSSARRRVLGAVAGTLAFGGVSAVLGAQQGSTSQPSSALDGPNSDPSGTQGDESSEVESLLADADSKSLSVDGLEPLVSEKFYQVDISNVDPSLEADSWSLKVTGAVEEEMEFDYEDLTSLPAENRFVTLRCVGDSLNGKKMDNALWTGVPVMDLLDEAGGLPDECCVMLRAADDYFEEFPLSALRNGFLAYGMNGDPLPRGHGHPVRALIPGHWGEINVKWLTEIEVLEKEQNGYWERRGWHGTGPVETVAKLYATNVRDDGTIQVGGQAYAGTRGIERVEVSTDGGNSWSDATLSEKLPGEDVWRQWEYTYEASDPHEVVVRATDGTGTLQPKEKRKSFPSGPTGWVSKRIEP
ncbi:molybdopterin-dependent oxidoreductase [Halorussus halophilus]|uniref:molybdopterin-dependent oxidoreductase n=1 Tax=Halorussus halophilus TaxID=2650975 RepID=UPI0013013098|nr:molybdopterin-dependent oxidoreductase [Halorussus halophilus]